MVKCQLCRKEEAIWAWQPFGPDSDSRSFASLGSHYRGFPVIKICDTCKGRIAYGKQLIVFTYKNRTFSVINDAVEACNTSAAPF